MLIERLLAFLRGGLAALRSRPGIIASLAIHLALVALLIGVHPARVPLQKRGDALIVELPNLQEPANRGQPGPVPGAAPTPATPEPKARPAPTARPAAPAPKQAPGSPARPQVAARPAPKAAEPREAPRAPVSPQQPPPASERGDVPAEKSAPVQPAPEVAKAVPEPPAPEPPRAEPPAPAETPPAPAAPPATATAPPSPPGPVAMVPPTLPDIRSALRRGGGGGGTGLGGAGGTGAGRGGIEGEPVPLDSKDPNFSDYLERVRALIKRHWSYPCVKNAATRECEYKSGQLVIEFGILRNGQLGFVELQRSSGHPIMDDYAANAIKLASPFPAIPPALLQTRTGPGLPIRANFTYVVENSLTNILGGRP